MKVPSTIESSEELGRGIFSSNQAKRARNAIPKNVFLEKIGIAKLSVDRLSVAPLKDIAIIADEAAMMRGRSFYGWACLNASKACLDRRKVQASPTQNNPYHADIELPEKAVEDKEEQMSHAQQLADLSTWQSRPS